MTRDLVLPPKVAPTQVIMIPIGPPKTREQVIAKTDELYDQLKQAGIRVRVDDRPDLSPGWKFNEYEMRGVPLRIELGPRDLENGQVVLATRLGEKKIVGQEQLLEEVKQMLDAIQQQMFERARAFMKEHTYSVDSLDELKTLFADKRGFVLAGWCGSDACEHQVKLETKATSRNIPFIVDEHKSKCLVCEEQAKHTVVFARAY